MHSLVMLAIPVNCALVVFTLGSFDTTVCGWLSIDAAACPPPSSSTGPSAILQTFLIYKMVLFIVMISTVFALVFSVATSVPRVPKDVQTNIQRVRTLMGNLIILDIEQKQEGRLKQLQSLYENQKQQINSLLDALK